MAQSQVRIKITQQIEGLDKMVRAGDFFAAWANRNLQKLYANAVRTRWISEGASETGKWSAIRSTSYKAWKQKRFADYPGGGEKLLIASSRLLAGMLPPEERGDAIAHGEEFRKMIFGKRVTFSTSVPYAEEVDAERDISKWSDKTIKLFTSDYVKYLAAGIRGKR
jgi:hypothetical protein